MNLNESAPVSNRLIRMANDAHVDAIIILDMNQRIVFLNNAAESIFRVTSENVVGQSFYELSDLLSDDKEITTAINNAIAGERTHIPANPKVGYRANIEHNILPLRDNGEPTEGILILAHKVVASPDSEGRFQQLNAELEKRVAQLRVNARDMAKFTTVISEEIKAPIRKIYTGIEYIIVHEAAKLSNNARAFFRRTQSSVNKMSLQLDNLLTIAELSTSEKASTVIDVDDVLKEQLSHLDERITAANAVITTGDLCEIRAHYKQIGLLLFHLIDNAIKFNKSPQKLIHITCDKIKLPAGERGAYTEKEYFRLSVSDNGIGFPQEQEEKIFELFTTLNENDYPGSGTGLAVVRKIVESNDGFVKATGIIGQGSIIECYFPVD